MPRKKTPEKRAAILTAAERVFSTRAFHDVLTDEIAAAAGVGKGTLYRYFDTKEDLYFAAVLRGFDEADARIAAGAGPTASTADRLEHIALVILEAFWGRRSFYQIAHRDARRFQAQDRELNRRRESLVAAVAAVLRDGEAAHELAPLDVELEANLFLGLVRAALFYRRASQTPAELATHVVRVFRRGVGTERHA